MILLLDLYFRDCFTFRIIFRECLVFHLRFSLFIFLIISIYVIVFIAILISLCILIIFHSTIFSFLTLSGIFIITLWLSKILIQPFDVCLKILNHCQNIKFNIIKELLHFNILWYHFPQTSYHQKLVLNDMNMIVKYVDCFFRYLLLTKLWFPNLLIHLIR